MPAIGGSHEGHEDAGAEPGGAVGADVRVGQGASRCRTNGLLSGQRLARAAGRRHGTGGALGSQLEISAGIRAERGSLVRCALDLIGARCLRSGALNHSPAVHGSGGAQDEDEGQGGGESRLHHFCFCSVRRKQEQNLS